MTDTANDSTAAAGIQPIILNTHPLLILIYFKRFISLLFILDLLKGYDNHITDER